jgi:hypothetical protein
MFYKKESYFYHISLERILNQLEQKFKDVDNQQIIDQLYSNDNTADEFSWVYENKNQQVVKSDDRLFDRTTPKPMWYGNGSYFYSKIFFPEDNFTLLIFRDLFDEFLTEINNLPGILRVNFFGLSEIGIEDHRDNYELMSGYHTFVALLNSCDPDTEFKINSTPIVNTKHFFYDVNANHSAKNLSKNWWYLITVDIDDKYITCK